MTRVSARKFALPKFPPARASYSQSDEQAFRRTLELALNGIFVATNEQAFSLSGLTLLGWTHTLTFSATDNDTVEWTSGSIVLPSGVSYAIGAGNTGNMTTITYVYLDLAVSSTALQTTTTASDSVGADRILVCVAQDVASGKDAQFQVFGGADDSELVLITADVIAANTITANEIAANTITAAEIAAGTITANEIAANTITAAEIAAGTITATEIAVGTITADRLSIGTLSAISADMGSLTAGSIVIGTTNKIWLNDSSDGALNIGGATKASAPFRVTAAGVLTATSATITGTLTAGSFIGADVVDTDAVQDGAITVDKLTVSTLSAITADLGTVTAGTISTNVLVAAESFTATNPTFQHNLIVEGDEGATRFALIAGSGASANKVVANFYDTSGIIQAALYLNGSDDFNVITGGELILDATAGTRVGGGGSPIAAVYTATKTWDPGSISAFAETTTTVTVTGAAVGDPVFVANEFKADDKALHLDARVTAADTVTLYLHNTYTGGALDPGSRDLKVTVVQFA